MRDACLLLVVLTFCVAAVSVRAQETEQLWDSGNAFLRTCHAADKSADEMTTSELCNVNHCLSFLDGLEEGVLLEMDLSRASGHPLLFPYCVTLGVTKEQPFRILLKYIRDNPAKTHLKTAVLFGMAMQEAFPCPDKK
jgi:hypothetical protein